jgi:hypothetical protein
MQRSPQDDEFLNSRRLSPKLDVRIRDTDLVKVSHDPVKISEPVAMEFPATTFRWTLKPEDLAHAFRHYIHDMIKGLPGHHFIKVEPVTDVTEKFYGLEITIVVPEKQ